ncbi:MAG TPA: glucose-6-phosphate isomerase [Thermotogota bacterium]|nr:glucose-6-phosphate isomerase [Thermotogota bacterium]HRW91557.1 glucose-6-phosphate isomerase [Thermotogota bacterium]
MLRFDFANLFQPRVSAGITPEEQNALLPAFAQALQRVKHERPGFVSLLDDLGYLDAVVQCAQELRGFEDFVVLGIGGSALGNIALQNSLRPSTWNRLPREKRNGSPRIHVWDNVDPEWIFSELELLDLSKTVFNVISKSGTTAEAMANFLVVRQKLQDKGLEASKHMVFTTDPERGVLHEIARAEGIGTLHIPPEVGGRFSVLTPVGLLSAAVSGIDIVKLVSSAKEARDRLLQEPPESNDALRFALTQYAFFRKGVHVSVMFPYANALYSWADWFRQLWAESLGKQKDTSGNDVFSGPTPVKALGATDQHSQVQLYNEGPFDKVFTLVRVEHFRHELQIPPRYAHIEALSYLGNATMSKLLNSEMLATRHALTSHQRPNCTLSFPVIDEQSIGEFIFTMELATTLYGFAAGINPFDQPGVEAGKKATYALMGRKGYEQLAAEILE